jgi:hypothetical protein
MNLKGYTIDQTYNLFPTCVIDFDLSTHPDILPLLDIIKETNHLCQIHGILENSVSSFGVFSILHDPRLVALRDSIQMCLFDYASIAGLEKVYITNSWYNIMCTDSKVLSHRHYGSTVSGAFYPLLETGSSNLFFNSPIAHCKMNDLPAGRDDNVFSSLSTEVNIKEGHLYLFPSWLEHGVNSNKTNNRIVVSFNSDRKKEQIYE